MIVFASPTRFIFPHVTKSFIGTYVLSLETCVFFKTFPHNLSLFIVRYVNVIAFGEVARAYFINGAVGNSKLEYTHFNMPYYVQRVKTNELIK